MEGRGNKKQPCCSIHLSPNYFPLCAADTLLKCTDMAANAFPEVFTVPPSPQAEVRKGLSEEQLRQYFDEGFVIVEDFIDQDLLNRVKKEWEDETNELVEKLYKAGKIKEKHQDQDFFHRLIHVDKEFPGRDAPQFSNRQELKEPAVVGASVLLHKKGVMGPVTREL